MEGLRVVGEERRAGLQGFSARGMCRAVDGDTWLWGDELPDYDGLLATVVEREARGDQGRRRLLLSVAQRLLDNVRVRELSGSERVDAEALLVRLGVARAAVGRDGGFGRVDGVLCEGALRDAAREVAGGCDEREVQLGELATGMLRRQDVLGYWDGRVEDALSPEMRPLHMSAVKEALGALIPAALHGSLDRFVAAQKDVA
eukprot:3305850-Pyramimonas_sp.AAC.1